MGMMTIDIFLFTLSRMRHIVGILLSVFMRMLMLIVEC